MKHVSIIILTYNAEEYIRKGFFDSIIKGSNLNNFKKSFIVFDNGSSDETLKLLKKRYPFIDIVYSYKNLGYGKGINCALQYAYKKYSSEYYVLSDQDVNVEIGYLQKLIDFIESKKDAGFVQPLVMQLKEKKEIYSAGHTYFGDGSCFPIKKIDRKKSFVEIPSGSILCSVVRKKALEKVGLLDERFYIYYESSDWGFRFRDKGFKNYCLYDSVVYHERNFKRTSSFQMFFVKRNKLLFWSKHDKEKFKKYQSEILLRIKNLKKVIKNMRFLNDSGLLIEYLSLREGISLASSKIGKNQPRIQNFNKLAQIVDNKNKKYF